MAVQNQMEKAKTKGKKKEKEKRKESERRELRDRDRDRDRQYRDPSWSDSEAHVGVAVTERDKEPCRRESVTEKDRERESAKLSFERDPRRHARRDPLAAATAGCCCSICLARPALSLHSSQVFTLIFSFKTLWSENQRNFACALWTCGVSCLYFYWWVMNWIDLVIVNWMCVAAATYGVFFGGGGGFLALWLLHYIDKRDR